MDFDYSAFRQLYFYKFSAKIRSMTKSMTAYYKRKAEYVSLLGGKCIVCGSKEALNFDHIDPMQKSFPVSSYLTHARKKILPEILKCQLLCEMHHKEKTRGEGSYQYGGSTRKGTWRHGTASAYRIGCRCDVCRKAYSLTRREHYLRTKK